MLTIATGATFRRAEGLTFRFFPCRGLDRVEVSCRRLRANTAATLSIDDVRILARLSRWTTAAELGVSAERLTALVEANCAFWSGVRPSQVLTGEPLETFEGAVALRRNVHVRPLLHVGRGEIAAIPAMPRRGSLDGAELGGMSFVTVEHDTDVAFATFTCCARHARACRDLVPLLDGRHTVSQLMKDEAMRPILVALDHLGLLERYEPRKWNSQARVTWLGHAGVLYEAAGKRIVVDPLCYPRSQPSRHVDRPFDPRDFGDIDAILITHGDNDHMHPATLCGMPRRTPVYIPGTSAAHPYQVDLRRVFETLGFENITELDEWQRVSMGGVTVVAAPFRGEDWGLTLACRTYLIHSPELTIYLNADSVSDMVSYERLAKEFKIDLAFVGVTGCAESHAMPPGYGYGEFYEGFIPQEKHNEWIVLCNGPREAAEAAQRLGARYAYGYAAGGASFCTLAYPDRGTHAAMAAFLEGGTTRPLGLQLDVPTLVPAA